MIELYVKAMSTPRVTPSVQKAILALQQYVTELEDESVQIRNDTMLYQQQRILIREKGASREAKVNQMIKPVAELNSRATLNLLQIGDARRQKHALRAQIADLESQIASISIDADEREKKENYSEILLQHYQALCAGFTVPPPLPYPHSSFSELNWALVNCDEAQLQENHRLACEALTSFGTDFNALPPASKKQVIMLLRELHGYASEIIKELKHVDVYVIEKGRHDALIRLNLRKYAAVARTMQKIRFLSPAQCEDRYASVFVSHSAPIAHGSSVASRQRANSVRRKTQ